MSICLFVCTNSRNFNVILQQVIHFCGNFSGWVKLTDTWLVLVGHGVMPLRVQVWVVLWMRVSPMRID